MLAFVLCRDRFFARCVDGCRGQATDCISHRMSPGEQGSGVCAKSGVLKQARRAPTAGFERAKNRSRQSTKTSKRFGPAASFLLASARDLRFSPRAIQQGNVGLLGTQNGIFRSARTWLKTPDSSRSYADPVLMGGAPGCRPAPTCQPMTVARAFSTLSAFHSFADLPFSCLTRNSGTSCPAFRAILHSAGVHSLS